MPISRDNNVQMPVSRFDPRASASSQYVPAARLAQLSMEMRQHPGRAIGGSGSTGLTSNDATGYSNMLADQQEYARLQDYMGGGEGVLDVQQGRPLESTRTLSTATGRDNSAAFGLPAGVSGASLEGLFDTAGKAGIDPTDTNRFISGNRYGRTTR